MSMKYNNQFVDEKYLPILEPNLYTDTVIIPGITYTDKYVTGPAGQLFIHKLAKGNTIEPGAPGTDFSHVETSDELIAIQINNSFKKSKKVYGVQAAAVDFALAEENMSMAVAEVREGRQYSALACLANEGTASTDTNAITTGDGAVEALLACRKAIKDGHGTANYALVSTKVYKLLLGVVGFEIKADSASRNAALLERFGLTVIECNSFDINNAKYINYQGTTKTIDLSKVEMIVGYNEAFSIVPNLEAMRMHDSPDFIGSLAQVELDCGFRVTSPAQVIVKKSAASI